MSSGSRRQELDELVHGVRSWLLLCRHLAAVATVLVKGPPVPLNPSLLPSFI